MGTALATPRPTSVAVLKIKKGAHSGVELPIDSGACRIGSSAESDIVLSDRDVAGDHATLRFERGFVFIEARGGDVGLDGGQVVPKGQGCKIRLPAEISLGGSVLSLAGEAPAPAWMQPPLAAVLCVALLLVGSIVATQAGVFDDEAVATPAPARVDVVAAPAAPSADPALALKEKIATLGIDGLSIEADGDRIVARGAVEDAARARWAEAQRWFDETYGGRFVLASQVGSKSAMARPRFQLQAIWFGPSPYVVTSDGQRRYAGATLGDGWVLKDIRENKILVSKADQEMALNY